MAGVSPRPQGHEGLATAPATQARSVCQVSLTGAPRSGSVSTVATAPHGEEDGEPPPWLARGGCQPPFSSPTFWRSGPADPRPRAPAPPPPQEPGPHPLPRAPARVHGTPRP